MNYFDKLNQIDVNEYTEKKNGLTYLSWSAAWKEIKKIHPTATYKVLKFENNLPYVFDEDTGYMVFTEVTIDDITHEMWLPVMDGANRSLTNKAYKLTNKYGKEISVAKATMFDINKTIMRCLTKNLAMHGLGLYIYNGEDFPEKEPEPTPPPKEKSKPAPKKKPETKKPLVEKDKFKLPGEDGFKTITQDQRKRVLGIAKNKQLSNDDVKKLMQEMFGIDSSKDLDQNTSYKLLVKQIDPKEA